MDDDAARRAARTLIRDGPLDRDGNRRVLTACNRRRPQSDRIRLAQPLFVPPSNAAILRPGFEVEGGADSIASSGVELTSGS